ncbi:MAG: imidazoleglycerol-phosphate dehydratase HisB [Candidatus Diapherotrites archaeon]|nr:imidazoleglycerol-phosphate dehydratase HisB [Candidatus Diapherotrites archaeon]
MKVEVERNTTETQVEVKLDINGTGERRIDTGVGFLDHMLELFAKQGLFDLEVKATGDLRVDDHHTVEDVGIVLGQAFRKAIGDKIGIGRYGYFVLPMDESLAMCAIDLCGRGSLVFNAEFERERVGDLSTELVYDFFKAFADNCGASVHVKVFYGRNEHHKIEAIFKAFAKAMRMACEIEGGGIPSTKGML